MERVAVWGSGRGIKKKKKGVGAASLWDAEESGNDRLAVEQYWVRVMPPLAFMSHSRYLCYFPVRLRHTWNAGAFVRNCTVVLRKIAMQADKIIKYYEENVNFLLLTMFVMYCHEKQCCFYSRCMLAVEVILWNLRSCRNWGILTLHVIFNLVFFFSLACKDEKGFSFISIIVWSHVCSNVEKNVLLMTGDWTVLRLVRYANDVICSSVVLTTAQLEGEGEESPPFVSGN